MLQAMNLNQSKPTYRQCLPITKNSQCLPITKNRPCLPIYPLGPCTDAQLLAPLSASLYLDAFLEAVRVSFVTVPLLLFLGLVLVRLLGLVLVRLMLVGWLVDGCWFDCLVPCQLLLGCNFNGLVPCQLVLDCWLDGILVAFGCSWVALWPLSFVFKSQQIQQSQNINFHFKTCRIKKHQFYLHWSMSPSVLGTKQ